MSAALGQSFATAQSAGHSDYVDPGLVSPSQQDIRRNSPTADNVSPGSAEVSPPSSYSQLSQYGLVAQQALDPTFGGSSFVATTPDADAYHRQDAVRHLAAKRRSLDQPLYPGHCDTVSTDQPKQRANSLTENISTAHGNIQ